MADASLARIESSLRIQQEALSELVEIALTAVKESADSSVSAIHMNTRLLKLAESLKLQGEIASKAVVPAVEVRSGLPQRPQ